MSVNGKNNFRFEVLKNLTRHTRTDLKITLLNYQNNYLRRSSIISNAAKSFNISVTFEYSK